MYAGNSTYVSRSVEAMERAAKGLVVYISLALLGAVLAIAVATASDTAIDAITILLFAGILLSFGEAGRRFAFHFFLVFNFGAFALTLGRLGMTGIIAPVLTAGGVFAILNIMTLSPASYLMNRSWTVLTLCGLALLSTGWSDNPMLTFKDALQLLFGTLLTIALVGSFGCNAAIQLLMRSMSFVCIASVVWAVVIPDYGVHQAYDIEQSTHAGLWRGVFTHKIALGTFAGLTFGLLTFYGWRAFANPFSYMVALLATIACVLKAGSATGVAMTLFFVGLLFATRRIALQGLQVRRPLLKLIAVAVLIMVGLIFSGLLDQFVGLLGRSSDLTGRAGYWPFIVEFMHKSDALLGYGYGRYSIVGQAIKLDAGMYLGEAHNGFLEMVVAFGYPGAILVTGIHMYLLWRGGRSLVGLPPRATMIGVLPFCFIATMLVSSYVESIILEKRGCWTILLTLSVCIIVKLGAAQKKARRPSRTMRETVRVAPVAAHLDAGSRADLYLPAGAAGPHRF